ncbi:CPBP family intramembrane glutamic endopeptidase [Nitrospirillum amazonense]|uniref:CPBP family intramembrane glutamic endopeptidase n=1 Tax=Nitrospirillum amazonense TaxID=28077 RepID=UPI00241257BF|nr:type II CAAX endopeptidase family protein [Nitrospirillum amazonense]MDG3439898.1 type II CAAX endopeptidase family protein [Nitrospirillum amazonense]
MMDHTLALAVPRPRFGTRLMAHPLVRILIGTLLTFAPVPMVMILATKLVDKSYRVVWPQLLAAVLVWFGYGFYVRRIEKRPVMELALPQAPRELGLGLLLGGAMVTAVFALLALLGVYRVDGVNGASLALFLPLAELVLVALAEEAVFRGIVFGVTERAWGSRTALAISALLFGLVHLPNEGISLLAVAAACAFGLLQAAIYMKMRRLWLCIGSHVAWNYSVGQVFSVPVSGHAVTSGLVRGDLAGAPWLTGGAFGVEGSLVSLVVIAIAALVWLRLAFGRPA